MSIINDHDSRNTYTRRSDNGNNDKRNIILYNVYGIYIYSVLYQSR